MKIAFIVNVFPRLSETFVLNQITGLIDLGHEVDIFAEIDLGEEKVQHQVIDYQLLRRTHYFIDSKHKWDHRRKYLLLLLKNFHKSPAKIIRALIVAKRFNIRPRESLRYVTPFLGTNYDIIHCQFATMSHIGIFLKEAGINGKVVTSFRGFDVSRIVMANPRIYDDLFQKGDLMLPNCNWFRKRLIDLGCNDNKIIIHHSGIDVEKFSFTERHLNEGDSINILTVARLTKKKGIEYSLQAVAKLMPKYPRLFYRIAGEGDLRDELEALTTQLGLKEHVEFLGYMDHDEVRNLMMDSHIFVLASVISEDGDEEGPSNVLNEAMASGMPVLGTDQTGFNEVVTDGVSGFLVPERDADALAERLDYLIQHPEQWVEMAMAGRENVKEHYEIHKLNQKLVKVYRGLINERG